MESDELRLIFEIFFHGEVPSRFLQHMKYIYEIYQNIFEIYQNVHKVDSQGVKSKGFC